MFLFALLVYFWSITKLKVIERKIMNKVQCHCIDEVTESVERFIAWSKTLPGTGGFVPVPDEVRVKAFEPNCLKPCGSYKERLVTIHPSQEHLDFLKKGVIRQ